MPEITSIYCTKCGNMRYGELNKNWKWCSSCRSKVLSNYATLSCSKCGKKVYETYTGGTCGECCQTGSLYKKSKVQKDAVKQLAKKVKQQMADIENLVKKTGVDKAPMKKGDVRRLPKNSSALWTDQWAVMGTGKFPYIVSHKKNAAGSSLEWQCSCPSWTTTTPREDCKHVLKVKLAENVPILTKTNGSIQVLNPNGTVTAAPPSAPVHKQGRKFR